jgi:homoserine O-acetyltransferase
MQSLAQAKEDITTTISASNASNITGGQSSNMSTSNTEPVSPGWWESVVGWGDQFGVDLGIFQVISASPLGGPFGTTSPLSENPTTGMHYGPDFPIITPLDQARVHAMLLRHLNIPSLHAVIGSSMGGMAALHFAVQFPEMYERVIAIATTPLTSPSTQALRSVQRSIVLIDPNYKDGWYEPDQGPKEGMGVARKMGTICYRSRDEFDNRFESRALSPSSGDNSPARHRKLLPQFPVDEYLNHVGDVFGGRYDANCWLTMSLCMDLMDLAETFNGDMRAACESIPSSKEIMLLPIAEDALILAKELDSLAALLGSLGKSVHHETLHSIYGHDAFLKEGWTLNLRMAEFLRPNSSGVEAVRQFTSKLSAL